MPSLIDIPTDDPLLLPKNAAELLGIQETTLATWRSQKRYNLRFIKLGKLIRYRKSDVLAFVDFCAQGGLDE